MKTFWTILISVVATVILVGGGIYYWQSNKAKNDKNNLNTQISSLQSQVKDLQTKLTAATATTTTSSSQTATTTATSTDYLATLKTFCDSHTGAGNEVKSYFYLENTDGKFGDCAIGQINGGAGGHLVSKIIDSKWTKIWLGNGYIDQATIDQYKIPQNDNIFIFTSR